ncbi:hypothetical protein VI817_004426 [Penicillium citrinum]|nr:hypothetical protein VI817_004426 [Penicillium citrinum]
MGLIAENFRLIYVGVAAAIYFRPEYVIFNSRFITVIVSFTILAVSRIIWQIALYPAYFTPVKHIQTPDVSSEPAPGEEKKKKIITDK